MSTKLIKENVEKALYAVLSTKDKISSIAIDGSDIAFIIEVGVDDPTIVDNLKKKCEAAVSHIDGAGKVTAIMTSEVNQNSQAKKPIKKPTMSPKKIKGVKSIIAVAAGKGGVGKSTISVNLAISLSQNGYKTGLVDADIHGPSISRMMNLNNEPEVVGGKAIPIENYGVKSISMGSIIDRDSAAIWRGPMVSKAINQLMLGVDWGELDYLIIDFPPGTGDIHLSVIQNFKIDNAIIVVTPQSLAIDDALKAISLFNKTNINIAGIVKNMSYFLNPVTDEKIEIFGDGSGIEELLDKTGLPIISEIPISTLLSKASDDGRPFVDLYPDDDISTEFNKLVKIIT